MDPVSALLRGRNSLSSFPSPLASARTQIFTQSSISDKKTGSNVIELTDSDEEDHAQHLYPTRDGRKGRVCKNTARALSSTPEAMSPGLTAAKPWIGDTKVNPGREVIVSQAG